MMFPENKMHNDHERRGMQHHAQKVLFRPHEAISKDLVLITNDYVRLLR